MPLSLKQTNKLRALLHSVCRNLCFTSSIRAIMLKKQQKGEGALDHSAVSSELKKFCSGCKKPDAQARTHSRVQKYTTKIWMCGIDIGNPKFTKLVQVRKVFLHEERERETQSFYADCFYIVSSRPNQRAAPVVHKFVWPRPALNVDSPVRQQELN